MEKILFSDDEFAKLKNAIIVYEWGQKILISKLQILSEALDNTPDSNPIEHMKWRMKKPLHIAKKLHRLGHELTTENAKKYLTDIAGIRIICSFSNDIKTIVDLLRIMPDIKITTEKDYIAIPKPSGYRSYHLIVEVPVYYLGKTEKVSVEVQLRTSAMDFWATLEHKVKYSHQNGVPHDISEALIRCADQISELDNTMFIIHDIINLIEKGEVVF